MTRSLSAENQNANEQRALIYRDFIWIVAKDRSDGSPVPMGVWSDVFDITAEVIDPATGGAASRSFTGAGAVISISDIPLVQGIAVQEVELQLSALESAVNDFLRTYDCKQADIQIFRGWFDPATQSMVAPAACRFAGFINDAPVTTPAEGAGNSVVKVSCTSNSQELTRANSDTASDASQRLRSATDNFLQDVAVVGDWLAPWGASDGSPTGMGTKAS